MFISSQVTTCKGGFTAVEECEAMKTLFQGQTYTAVKPLIRLNEHTTLTLIHHILSLKTCYAGLRALNIVNFEM